MNLAEALDASAELEQWLQARISTTSFSVDPGLSEPELDRIRMALALLDLVQELHRSTELLMRNTETGSAFTLLRATFESLVRAVWLFHSAGPTDVERYMDDKPPSIGTMMEALTKTPYGVWFHDMYKRSWAAMCSYAHGGFFHASYRITPYDIQPRYPEKAQVEVMHLAGSLALLSALEIAVICDNAELRAEAVARIKAWYQVTL